MVEVMVRNRIQSRSEIQDSKQVRGRDRTKPEDLAHGIRNFSQYLLAIDFSMVMFGCTQPCRQHRDFVIKRLRSPPAAGSEPGAICNKHQSIPTVTESTSTTWFIAPPSSLAERTALRKGQQTSLKPHADDDAYYCIGGRLQYCNA